MTNFGEWVKASEALPENFEWVIVINKDQEISVARYSNESKFLKENGEAFYTKKPKGFWFCRYCCGLVEEEIIYWMRFPAFPEKKND